MSAARGTTPTLDLILHGVDLTEAENVYVTFHSGLNTLTKTGKDLITSVEIERAEPVTTVSLRLSQVDTLHFERPVAIQVNWTYADGSRASSNVAVYNFSEQLLNKVVE